MLGVVVLGVVIPSVVAPCPANQGESEWRYDYPLPQSTDEELMNKMIRNDFK